jgi:ribonuclease G
LSTDILISSDPWENRVAILEDEKLVEYYVEREEKIIGSIYKGKVQNVLPGMGASFVDIGLGRNAFLYVDDINKQPLNIGDVEVTQGRSGFTINEKVSRGDDVLVQVVKEPRGLKGARVSTNISLPGRYLILMPTGKYSGVSRKIDNVSERERLRKIVQRIRPEGMATVVRTAASGVSDAELIADLGVLLRMWHGIVEQYNRAPAASLLHKDMNLVFKAARDFITVDVGRVLVDDAEESDKIKDFMRLLGPQYLDRIETYSGGRKLFTDYHVDDEVSKLMRPKVNLPSGGSIVIETTEAFTVIDVNSGKFTGGRNLEDTILKTNLEAASEVARQVRLRDIGGIIVCDFIDMRRESSRNQVIEMLEKGLRRDRTRSTIQSFSALGLLEFTRKRVGRDLAQQLRSSCPSCNGLGTVMSPETVAIDAFRRIREHHHTHATANGKPIHVVSSPTVAAQIDYWYEEELGALASELGSKIDVRVDTALGPDRMRIVSNGDVKKLPLTVRVGDEVEVDIISAGLPNTSSGLAVIDGRLVEVENAAGAVGQAMKIKIIDIDEDETEILAELRTPVAGEEPARRRRRRGGRGRKRPLTAAEQTEELRELAEEAERGLSARSAIGISTAEEAETEAAAEKTKATQSSAEIFERRADEANVVGVAEAASFTSTSAPGSGSAPGQNGEEQPGRRRRRRRRRARHSIDQILQTNVPEVAPAQQPATEAEGGAETAPRIGPDGETLVGGGHRRRRRRRRRGRGGRPHPGVEGGEQPTNGIVPDRHIFRVDGDGGAYATGETAPREPSRAIANVRQERVHPPAIEAPPPSLTAPEEPAKTTRPARRRRTASADGESAPASIQASEVPALPAPKRRTRKAASAETATEGGEAAETPKRRTRATSTRKTPTKKTSARKKSE